MTSEATGRSREGDSMAPVVPFPGLRKRPVRERLQEAMLEVSGELGYEQVAVKHVIERAKSSRATFYKNFNDKEDCFAQAHHDAGEWLYRRVMGVAEREEGWREGLRVGMAALLEFCANQPAIAKALLVEVHAAGERALEQRSELMRRFAEALDSAREELSDRSAPAITGAFMVGSIETMIAAKLMDDDAAGVPDLLPGILHFVVMQYYGEEAAWEEMTAAPLAQWSIRREAASEMPS